MFKGSFTPTSVLLICFISLENDASEALTTVFVEEEKNVSYHTKITPKDDASVHQVQCFGAGKIMSPSVKEHVFRKNFEIIVIFQNYFRKRKGLT